MKHSFVIAATVGAAAALLSLASHAATIEFKHRQNATAICQPALPAFDGQIRKRPLAVQNEGTELAFVTCSFIGNDTNTTSRVSLYFINNGPAAASVSCTLVSGYDTASNNFGSKSVSVLANRGGQANIAWTAAADNSGNPLGSLVNVSCSLPPGTGINDIYNYYQQEIGS